MNGKRFFLDTNAVIAASAAVHVCLLVTADKHLLKIPGLAVQGYQAV